tara:strand:+ start:204 stop:1151 length:948 start_codon:yes stop_codon:yes gene_type:complete
MQENHWDNSMSSNNPSQIDNKPTGATASPDPDKYPRINTCCPCMDCLDSCIRQIESGGTGSPVLPDAVKPDPKHEGCDARATDCGRCDTDGDDEPDPVNVPPGRQFDSDCDGIPDCSPGDPCDEHCDCGPYQIDWNAYVHDICGPVGPCSNGDGGYDNSCCEVCDPGFGQALCQPCGNNAACCAEKTRRSLKLIDCWRRRYTRNPSNNCKGSGDVTHPSDPASGKCFTCEDLARMHNGGPCGHKRKSTEGYWDKIKACMQRNCQYEATETEEACCDDCQVQQIPLKSYGRPPTQYRREKLDRQSKWEDYRKRTSE